MLSVGAFEEILGLVGGDACNPGLVVVPLVGVNVPVGGEEGLLGEILGLLVVLDQLVTDGEDQLFVLFHKCSKFLISHSACHPPPFRRPT